MRGLFKISLAVLALSFLVASGSAFAQDSGMQKPTLQITGIFNAGFGLETFDKVQNSVCNTNCLTSTTVTNKSYQEWVTSYEHRIRFIYGTDDLQGRLVFRPRGESGGSNSACSEASGVQTGGAGVNVGNGACPGTNSSGAGSSAPSGTAAAATGAQQLGGQPQSGGNPFLQDIYGTITWKPMKQLGIEFGRMEGPAVFDPIAGSYYMANPVMNGPEYWMNWTNQDGIVFTYDAGMFTAGVGVSSQCKPRCSTGNYQVWTNQSGTTAAVVTPLWTNTQSITPFINGKVGDIGFRAQLPMTSGDATLYESDDPTTPGQLAAPGAGTGAASATANKNITSKTRTESGSGYDVGVSFTGMPGMLIAANIQSFTVGKDTAFCAPTTGTGSGTALSLYNNSCKDWTRDGLVVKFEFQGLQVGFFDQNTDSGTGAKNAKQEDTYLKVHYMFPVGPGVVGPEYTMATLGKRQLTGAGTMTGTNTGTPVQTGAYDGTYKDISLSLIRLVGKISF